MLWYLLYPIRGTTQPPTLSANHPVRRAFYRHGKTTAEHWLVAMLVTVAVAMAFSYPTILLAENPTAGFAAYPHHVWTTAKPHDENPGQADVEMRQVWIHGNYMGALEKDVLKRALDIQQTLIGTESWKPIFPSLRSSTLSWGYHSPLMYWNNSQQILENDDDILKTIHRQARSTSSSVSVALRPASVFAGKKFDHRKLTAADALVITLMNKVGGGVGNQWRDRMSSLTTAACKNCTLFPEDGLITRSRVYEFSFTPLSAQENVAFTVAYSFMALYVLLSLRRLKAFHSRFGLVVTAITQMTCSILASFTICGMLKINLSMIPQNAYPFVVLVIGLENMFRIINAVLAYPATMATDLRLANALGDVGPVSVATAAQNLIILSLLARVVSPGVAAFCAFACIATLFDVFFLLTFFVAVLMVDIRRFELQDALSRSNQSRSRHRRKPSPYQHTWFDALVHGRLPFSTRMAGTAVTTTFILSLNYHFFEHHEQATSIRHLFRMIKEGPPNLGDFDTFAPLPINATMTPGQWMRMQDFETTREVMRLAKPGADSFIIRIFAPLIVVLAGSDRTGMDGDREWSTALRSFAMHHFYPVATAVVFAVAFVAVLMNFLLYTEHEDAKTPDIDEIEQPALRAKTVALPHRLDIVKLSGTNAGHFVSVALDRTIAIALFEKNQQTHQVFGLPNEVLSSIRWPIYNVVLEVNGEWISCHCGDDRIMIISTTASSTIREPLSYPDDNPGILFRFAHLPCDNSNQLHFVMLTSGGRLVMLNVETNMPSGGRLLNIQLLGATIIEGPKYEQRLLTVTDEAELICFLWKEGDWIQTSRQSLPTPTPQGRLTGAVRIEQYSELDSDILVIVTTGEVLFLESKSLVVLSKFQAKASEPSIINVLLGSSAKCKHCGSLSFRSVTIVGEATPSNVDCVLATLSAPEGDDAVLCVRKGAESCLTFEQVERTVHRIPQPGAWSAVASQTILGLRKPALQTQAESVPRQDPNARLRRRQRARSSDPSADAADVWEGYKISARGQRDTIAVSSDYDDPELGTALYVSNAGPAVPLDEQSVAVAFGNTVKIIQCVRSGSGLRRPTGRTLVRQPLPLKDEIKSRKTR